MTMCRTKFVLILFLLISYKAHSCDKCKIAMRLSITRFTGDEAFKSICRILGPLTKNPTLGVQHAVEAGYLFKEHASISAWFF